MKAFLIVTSIGMNEAGLTLTCQLLPPNEAQVGSAEALRKAVKEMAKLLYVTRTFKLELSREE